MPVGYRPPARASIRRRRHARTPVAAADVNGDGAADIITVPGPAGVPDVKVFDGVTGQTVKQSFFAYDPGFRGGVFVAVGQNGPAGTPTIVTGPGFGGGPNVRVFDASTGVVLQSFLAYDPTFRGGVRVAAADLNADGTTDLIAGPGPTGGPVVRAFDGRTLALLDEFLAYDPGFTSGVFVGSH